MESTNKVIEGSGLRDQVKIIVGDAPVTQEYADKIETDGFAADASRAAALANLLIGK